MLVEAKMRIQVAAFAALLLAMNSSPTALASSSSSSDYPSYRTIMSRFGSSSLRLKSWPAEQLCPGAAAHHAGWADIDTHHLFFWFHEARHDPENAPLLLWLQGEPGVSSLHGMLYENSPCLAAETGTRDNSYSWTEYFNVVYVDQPDVGFSYIDGQTDVEVHAPDAEELSSDIISYLKLLYEAFPHMKEADLHIAGGSYAGYSISALVSMIIDYNEFLLSAPLGSSELRKEVIPLRSIILGNPLIDPAVQLPASYDASCVEYRGRFPPRVSEQNCGKALAKLDDCETAAQACSRTPSESLLCAAARDSCVEKFLEPLKKANTSTYDRRRINCDSEGDCYDDIEWPSRFLNSEEILDGMLEVDGQTGGRKKSWRRVSDDVVKRYSQSGFGMASSVGQLARVLKAGRESADHGNGTSRSIDVLIYAGVTDPTLDPDGVFEALRGVKWDGRAPFRSVPWEELPWSLSEQQRSGRLKAFSNLWMLELEEAGRMASYDQPGSVMKMLEFWLQNLRAGSLPSRISEQEPSSNQKIFQSEEL